MNDRCERFDQYRETLEKGCTGEERREIEAHLARCADCRDQALSHDALEGLFAESEVPELSPAFDAELFRRLGSRRTPVAGKGRPPRWPILMQAYWLAVCLASLIIVVRSEVVSSPGGSAMIPAILFLAVPTLLLGGVLRSGLLDLIFSTMKNPEERFDWLGNGNGAP